MKKFDYTQDVKEEVSQFIRKYYARVDDIDWTDEDEVAEAFTTEGFVKGYACYSDEVLENIDLLEQALEIYTEDGASRFVGECVLSGTWEYLDGAIREYVLLDATRLAISELDSTGFFN